MTSSAVTTIDENPGGIRVVREVHAGGPLGLVHPEWTRAFPWLVQGTTTRGSGARPFDLGLFSGGSPVDEVRANWAALSRATAQRRLVHARQVHGAEIRRHGAGGSAGGAGESEPGQASHEAIPLLVEPCDGHVTDEPGVLLTVTTADCVPVSIVDPERRTVAALHAGWRGAAAGILERGLAMMRETFGTGIGDVHVHAGPSICGACYEVGPEVFAALGLAPPPAPEPIDLRRVLVERAVGFGVDADRVTISAHCTRCTGSGLFSHRGGHAHRQITYLGVGAG